MTSTSMVQEVGSACSTIGYKKCSIGLLFLRKGGQYYGVSFSTHSDGVWLIKAIMIKSRPTASFQYSDNISRTGLCLPVA